MDTNHSQDALAQILGQVFLDEERKQSLGSQHPKQRQLVTFTVTPMLTLVVEESETDKLSSLVVNR